MVKQKFSRACLIILLFLIAPTLGKAESYVIPESFQRAVIGEYCWIYQDSQGLSLQEVIQLDAFERSGRAVPNLGLSQSYFWVKFTIHNQSKLPDFLLEVAYPILDELVLFQPEKGNRYAAIYSGELKAFNDRVYKQPNFIFDISIPQGVSKTFYLRVKSAEQIILPVYINRPKALWESTNKENMITGIYAGIIMIMFIYNLFLFLSTRDKSYVYYIIYVACLGLTQIGIKGFTFQFLWPHLPAFEVKSIIIFASLAGMAGLAFTRNFLQIKKYFKRMNIGFSALIGLFTVAIACALLGFEYQGFFVMQAITSLSSIYILVISYVAVAKGHRPAKFFALAWTVLLIGAIVFLLKDYGVLPYNIITNYSMQAASAVEMALLSFALADRINILKKEKEDAQLRQLTLAKENERMAKEQAEILEEKVKERTMELQAAVVGLNEGLNREKELQGELVQSRKMVSIGQLTAGVAHEISNPLNFISNGIEILQRDVDDFRQVMDKYGEIAHHNVDQKLQEIEEFKQEISLDEVSEEIDYMFNGMKDGTSRVEEIVNTLKNFSRLDESDYKLADIHMGLDSTLTLLKYKLNNEIKIDRKYGQLPDVECYPGQLNQVFMNVLNNAIWAIHDKDMPNNKGIITITTNVNNDKVVYSIQDNGIGIAAAKIPSLFDAFYTTREVGSGTGLGLFISYGIIEKHRGKIEVNSVEGKGTDFIISIPIKQMKK